MKKNINCINPLSCRTFFIFTLAFSNSVLADTTGKLYVAGDGTGNVAVIDAHTNTLSNTISVGTQFSSPHNFVASPDNKSIWVTLRGTGEIARINTLTDTVEATYTTGGTAPVHVDVSQDGNWLYAVNKVSDQVVKMSTADGSIAATYNFSPTLNYNPHDINVSPDGNSIWVTDELSGIVSVLDTNLSAVTTTINVGDRPIQTAFSNDGSQAYITNFNDNTVSVIDVASTSLIESFPMTNDPTLQMGPMGAVVSPDGSSLWLTGTAGNTLHRHSLVNGDNYSYTETNGLLAAHGLDISDNGSFLYTTVKADASSADRDAVAVIDAATGTVVTTIQTTGASNLHGLVYVSAVPVPAAVWLFASGLLGLIGFARVKK